MLQNFEILTKNVIRFVGNSANRCSIHWDAQSSPFVAFVWQMRSENDEWYNAKLKCKL